MTDELIRTISQLLGWLSSVIYLAMGIAAFARLRATPAGLLMGSSLLLVALIGCTSRAARSVVMEQAGYEPYMWISVGSSCIHAFLFVLFAAGIALIPRSLATLANKKP